MEPEIRVEDGVVENILKELEDGLVEKVYSRDMIDCACANTVLNQMDSKEEKASIRKDIVKAFVVSSWAQRIYFVVRSLIMTIFGAIVTLLVFWRLGKIDIVDDFILGISLYLVSLVLSRLFDKNIVDMSKNVLRYLEGHDKLRDLIVRNF